MRWVYRLRFLRHIAKHPELVLLVLFLFFAYLTNTFHTQFPDEFDNIVGGWYITKGLLPYTGFFTHHNPGAYFLSSLIVLFSGRSFVTFRIIWALVLFAAALGGFALLVKRVGTHVTRFYPAFLAILVISSTFYWGHMMLSETIVGYVFIPAYALVFLKSVYNKPLTRGDMIAVSVLTAIAMATSLTFAFAVAVLIGFALYRYIRTNQVTAKDLLILGAIFAFPYIIFALYLAVTASLSEFYFQSVFYNREYYIYNFPKVAGEVSKNPVRFAISIFYNTFLQFYALLPQVASFNLSFPVNISLLLGNVALLFYLIARRKFFLAAVVYVILTYLNARAEPLDFKEGDFHATVYVMVSLFNGVFVLVALIGDINALVSKGARRAVEQGLLLLFGVYAFFTAAFFLRGFLAGGYTRFMGQAPGIVDAPVAAPIINRVVSPDEYFWIGPFEFQELLYVNGKLPSKYHWFLPASGRSPRIRAEIIRDFSQNRPKVIVLKKGITIFGSETKEFAAPILDFLDKNYVQLHTLDGDKEYEVLKTDLHNFDIARDFYFDETRQEEIIQQLLAADIIRAKQ